jgi:hypothetical protein
LEKTLLIRNDIGVVWIIGCNIMSRFKTDVSQGILDDGITLPLYLYDLSGKKSKSVSPAARFDPVSAVGGSAWQSSTSPSAAPQKKNLILDRSFFKVSEESKAIALVARLKNAGFTFYFKDGKGDFYKVDKDLDNLIGGLRTLSNFEESDYTTLAETYGIARDKAVVLDKKNHVDITKFIQKDRSGPAYLSSDGLESHARMMWDFKISLGAQDKPFVDLSSFLKPEKVIELATNDDSFIESQHDLFQCIQALIASSRESAIPGILKRHKHILTDDTDLTNLAQCAAALAEVESLKGLAYGLLKELKPKSLRVSTFFDYIAPLLNDEQILEFLNKGIIEEPYYGHEIATFIEKCRVSQRLEKRIPRILEKYFGHAGDHYLEYLSKVIKDTPYISSYHFNDVDHFNIDFEKMGGLARCIKLLKVLRKEDLIPGIVEKHGTSMDSGYDLSSCISELKGTRYEKMISWLVGSYKKPFPAYEVVTLISAIKGSSQEHLIENILEQQVSSAPVSYINAIKDSQFENKIPDIVDKYHSSISSYKELYYWIDALKDSPYEDKIEFLVKKYYNTAVNGSLHYCIDALKGSSQETLIPWLIDNCSEKDGHSLLLCIGKLKGTPYENKIQPLLELNDGIKKISTLLEYISALNGSLYEYKIPELIDQHKDKIRSYEDLFELMKALDGSLYEYKLPEILKTLGISIEAYGLLNQDAQHLGDTFLACNPNLGLSWLPSKSYTQTTSAKLSPTSLHIARLNNNEQLNELLKTDLSKIVTVKIIVSDKPELVAKLVEKLPQLKYLSLPENLKDKQVFAVNNVKYHDYSMYIARPGRDSDMLIWNDKRRGEFGEEGADSDLFAQDKNSSKKKGFYVAQGEVGEFDAGTLDFASFDMFSAGEVLNRDEEPQIRKCIIKFKDIRSSLDWYEYTPSKFKDVIFNELKEKQITDYKKKSLMEGTFYRFNLQGMEAGKRYKLLSVAASEELVGVMATNDAKIKIERGDDDFFYATSDRNCDLSHVTKVVTKDESKFAALPTDHPIKRIVDDFVADDRANPFRERMPAYTPKEHQKWLRTIFDLRAGECRHKVAGMFFKLLESSVKEEDIRVSDIDGNHVKIEMKYDNKWFSITDLGGWITQEFVEKHIDKTYSSAPAVTGKTELGASYLPSSEFGKDGKGKEKDKKQVEIKEQKEEQIEELQKQLVANVVEILKPLLDSPFTPINKEDVLKSQTVNSDKKRIFVKTNNIDGHANCLLAEAKAQGRPVYYIDSPDKIDFDRDTIIIRDVDGKNIKMRADGLFADFLSDKSVQKKPLVLIKWDAFPSHIQIQLNTLIDTSPTVHGRKPALPMQVISFSTDKTTDISFLSRHETCIDSTVKFIPREEKNVRKARVVDLQGLPNWKAALFAPVALKDGRMEWRKSRFARRLLAGYKKFELVNLSPDAAREFEYEYKQAKAAGAFVYNGVRIPLSQDVSIIFKSKEFDFSDFKELSAKKNVTFDKVPADVKLVNTYLFDYLLHQKAVHEGSYTETPGLIKEAALKNEPLKLFISSTLSDNQWYCLFNQANQHKVPLELYLAPGISLPQSLPEPKKIKTDAQVVADKNMPKIIVSNDTEATVKELKAKSNYHVVIDIEDYSYQDLVGGIKFKIKDHAFRDFKEVASPVIEALKAGKNVILKGEFARDLLQMLHPVLAGQPPQFTDIGKNLTLIIEDKSITGKATSYSQLTWLPNTAYTMESHAKAKAVSSTIVFKEKPDLSVDLTDSKAKSEAFIAGRRKQLLSMLENSDMLQLVGTSGVGKSRLMKMIEETGGDVKVYYELGQLKACATELTDAKEHILFIDESNIDDIHYTMFSPLKAGGNGKVLYDGELLDLRNLKNKKGEPVKIKIVFASNPKEYGGGRNDQKLFEDGSIPQMHVADFPSCYIYEQILKAAIYNKCADELKKVVSEDQFKKLSQLIIKDYYNHNAKVDNHITVRELQHKAMAVLSELYDRSTNAPRKKELKSENFVSTHATKEAVKKLRRFISIQSKQREGLLPGHSVGLNIIVLEGEPGVGKTELIRAMFSSYKIKKATTKLEKTPGKLPLYYKVDASLSLEKKKQMLIKAARQKDWAWIDEINSCMDDGLEKVINALTTGVHPDTGETIPPLKLITSINPISMGGRGALSPAVQHRSVHQKVASLKEYKIVDWEEVIKHWRKKSKTPEKIETEVLAGALVSLVGSSEKTKINLRTLERELPKLEDNIIATQQELVLKLRKAKAEQALAKQSSEISSLDEKKRQTEQSIPALTVSSGTVAERSKANHTSSSRQMPIQAISTAITVKPVSSKSGSEKFSDTATASSSGVIEKEDKDSLNDLISVNGIHIKKKGSFTDEITEKPIRKKLLVRENAKEYPLGLF